MRSGTAALFWKEWRESGVPLAIAVVLTSSWEGLLAMQRQTQSPTGAPHMAWTAVFWPFLALCAASPALAGETRARTLEFLAGLPVSREWLWRVKATATLLLWVLMLALSLFTWTLLGPILFGSWPSIGLDGRGVPDLLSVTLRPRDVVAFGLGLGAALLGAAFLLSALLESAAIAGTLALAAVTSAALGLHRAAPDVMTGKPGNWLLLGLLVLAITLPASRAAFTAGDLRPDARKLAAAGRTLALPAALAAVLGLLYVLLTYGSGSPPAASSTPTVAAPPVVPTTIASPIGTDRHRSG